MLDVKAIRENPEFFIEKLSLRDLNYSSLLNDLLTYDKEKRKFQAELEELKSKRNSLSKSVKSPEDAERIKAEVKKINEYAQSIESKVQEKELEIENIIWILPNVTADDVPKGKDESENVELKKWGTPKEINNPKEHFEIAEKLGMLDIENTVRVCGSRFSSFVGAGARLQRALINFMLEEAYLNGYTEISPPAIVNSTALKGTGQLPKFKEDLYELPEQQYLIPTAEVPLTNFFAIDKPIQEQELTESFPRRLCAYTPCFRKEAGSAGKDTRGIIRQHQFDKIELVHVCLPEQSEEEHERLTRHAEGLLEKLELPYRRIILCSGDIGFSARKCYDIEVWFPSQNKYREISSCSNCGDFQARRMNFRFKKTTKTEFFHTLNGSGLAVGRCWAAILENYLQDDGRVKIPDVLKKYMFGEEYF